MIPVRTFWLELQLGYGHLGVATNTRRALTVGLWAGPGTGRALNSKLQTNKHGHVRLVGRIYDRFT